MSVDTPPSQKLLILGPWRVPPPAAQVAHIQARFPHLAVQVYEHLPATGDDDDFWRDVTVLVTSGTLPAKTQAPSLRYVQLWTAAVDQVLGAPVLERPGVACCTANGVHGPQIAEWIMATFLAATYKIPTYLQQQQQGNWTRLDHIPHDSAGKRVGILGYGSIGRQTARVAKALGMTIYALTRRPRLTAESRRDASYAPAGLGDPDGVLPSRWFSAGDLHGFLGSRLDLLVVALPLTGATRGILARPELEILGRGNPGGTFVANVSRGPLIHTADLVRALDEGLIAGAALDTTDPEPLPAGHPLWTARNVIITPHVSGSSRAYGSRVMDILELNLGRLREGERLMNLVSREEGY
ncbi:hypothetical protein E4U41_000231 [Claviceps citrina]|nr:hypothetical protein E4U41_000231 [Claviceps citrina]